MIVNNQTDLIQTYTFGYTDIEGKTYEKKITTSGMTWMECLNDYVRFLESVFQYDIMSKVQIEEPDYLGDMYVEYPDYNNPWSGEYFVNKPQEEENDENISDTRLSD